MSGPYPSAGSDPLWWVDALCAAGAQIFRAELVFTDSAGNPLAKPIKKPKYKGWMQEWCSPHDMRLHLQGDPARHIAGIVPSSIGAWVADLDEGDPIAGFAALGETVGAEPFAVTATRREGGYHAWFRAYPGVSLINNGKWAQSGSGGDIRGSKGWIALWQPEALLAALPRRDAAGYANHAAEGINDGSVIPPARTAGGGGTAAGGAEGWDRGNRNNMLFQVAKDAGRANDVDARDAALQMAHECGLVEEDGIEKVTQTLASGWNAGIHELRGMRDSLDPAPETAPPTAPVVTTMAVETPPVERAGDSVIGYRAMGHDRFAEIWRQTAGKDFRATSDTVKSLRVFQEGEGWREGTWAANAAVRTMRKTIRDYIAGNTADEKWVSEAHIKSSVRLAITDDGMLKEEHEWNTDPVLAGLPGGQTVNLATGETHPSRVDEYVSKRLGASLPAMGGFGLGPLLESLVGTATAGDATFRRALRALAGSVILGLPEKALPLLVGPTNTGKSQFIEILLAVSNDYATGIRAETLTGSRNEHPTVIMNLKGRRGVLASEMTGGMWRSGQVKRFTGADTLSGRGMHQDESSFRPTHTLVLACNPQDMPGTAYLDDAMLSRIRIIPFENLPPPDAWKNNLAELVKTSPFEMSAAVGWAVEGAADVLRYGLIAILDQCAAIGEATAEWEKRSDVVGTFLEDRCVTGPEHECEREPLYTAYKWHCQALDEPITSSRRFYESLREKGFGEKKNDGRRVFIGIALRT